jgi:hypothetical protein
MRGRRRPTDGPTGARSPSRCLWQVLIARGQAAADCVSNRGSGGLVTPENVRLSRLLDLRRDRLG